MKKILVLCILGYLRTFAKIQQLKNRHAIVLGITGSAGKTTTRLALVTILNEKGIVKHTINANSESGIALNMLGLSMHTYTLLDWARVVLAAPLMILINWRHFDYYVVEMGIDSPLPPKNMRYLLSIIRPQVGIVLNAGLVHAAAFDALVKDKNPERRGEKIRHEIAKEKMVLVKGIDPTGVAIVNKDDAYIAKETRDITARLLTYGRRTGSTFHITHVSTGKRGFCLQFTYQNAAYELALPDPLPEHYAYSFLAAIAGAAAVGVPTEKSIVALSRFRAPAGRFRMFRGVQGSTVIDSSYNASPDTIRESLIHFAKIAGRAHKIAIVGDMRELGMQTKVAHKELADELIRSADEAILFGKETLTYTLPILERRRFPVHHFTRMKDLIRYVEGRVKEQTYILVKGSQNNILLERAVEALLANRKDASLLCRRGPHWDRVRAHTS